MSFMGPWNRSAPDQYLNFSSGDPTLYNMDMGNRWTSTSEYPEPSRMNQAPWKADPTNAARMITKFSVKGYKPEELKLTVENGFMVIRGSHSKICDENITYVSRKFTRRVPVPAGVVLDEINAEITNGILSIIAQKKPATRRIPVYLIDQPNIDRPIIIRDD